MPDQTSKSRASNIRLIVCDLDGTLLHDDKSVSEYTRNVFARASERGIKICFASGRANQMMTIFQPPFIHCDHMIAFNGGTVEDVDPHAVHYQSSMSEMDVCQILDYAEQHHLIFTMYSGTTMFYSKDEKKLIDRIIDYEKLSKQYGMESRINALGIAPGEYRNLSNLDGIVKIVIYEDDQTKVEQFKAFITTIPSVYLESTGYGLTGVFDKTVSKKSALEWLGGNLGINKNEICAFGDFDNDLSLFEAAGISVAVGNATEIVKKSANYLTLSNNQDGVAKFIDTHILSI